MKTGYRYGLRRQLLLNLGLVVLVVWGLLSLVLTRTAYLRFMQERVRYIQALSEQMEQIILLKFYGSRRKGGLQLWFGGNEFRRNSVLWPSQGLMLMKDGTIRPIFGVPSKRAIERVKKWQFSRRAYFLRQFKTEKGKVVWERYKKLLIRGQFVGVLWLSWDVTGSQGEFFSYQGLLFLSLLLFGFLILFLSLSFLERRLIIPLDRLSEAIVLLSLGQKGEDLRKELTRRDEIGDLARTFVEMEHILSQQAEEKEKHITELAEANAALERAQEELVQREKMATVGFLSAGVAHEVGNPLSAIMGYSELLKGSESWGEMEADLVHRIHKETQRIDRIIRDLLDYARPVVREYPGEPKRAIEEALELLRLQQRFKTMNVEVDIADSLPLVCLSEEHLVQVLINLLLNAADACEGQGVIQIRACLSASVGSNSPEEKPVVLIDVCDDGPGIDSSLWEQIFEPFVTTKPTGKGVGLGLALSHRLVRESGGSIELMESEKGAHFRLILSLFSGSESDSEECS